MFFHIKYTLLTTNNTTANMELVVWIIYHCLKKNHFWRKLIFPDEHNVWVGLGVLGAFFLGFKSNFSAIWPPAGIRLHLAEQWCLLACCCYCCCCLAQYFLWNRLMKLIYLEWQVQWGGQFADLSHHQETMLFLCKRQ